MTNTEIIEKLKGYKGIIMYPTEEAEALKDAAIQALSQEPILDKLTEIIEPLRHLAFDEMSDVERQILQVIDKYAEQEPCYEEQQNDKKCGSYNNTNTFKSCSNCKLIGTDSCYMVCGGSKLLYKPKQKIEPCDKCRYKRTSICGNCKEYDEFEPCDDAISQNQSNACSILDDECPYPYKHCWECPLNYQYELAKHELDKNVDLPSVTQKPIECADAVNRQAVLDTLNTSDKFMDEDRTIENYKALLKECYKVLPPVTQKSGKWIKVKSGDKDFPESIVCSRCNNENSHLDFNENAEPIGKVFVTSKFCPNCGAKMEGSEVAE